jgi:UDPglucose 6-dehydrogenase
VEFVVERATRLFPHLEAAPIVLVSSQVPVGTTRRLEEMYRQAYPGGQARFAYSPENLRLGKAVDVFQHPDRIVVGVRSADDRQDLARLFHPWTDRIAWMGVESAEMAKHALNAFLATSVTFANEVASLCEHVGADAKDVERALKSDIRIGHKAYVAPGSAFAGGTLARDVVFLGDLGRRVGQPTPVLSGVRESNEHHKRWVHRHLEAEGALRRRRIGVWGLTYKPGTDTLRRSLSVELCLWLSEQGAVVRAHDPAVRTLPAELAGVFELASDPLAAAADADVLVVSTEWPEYRQVLSADVIAVMRAPFVLDPNRFLAGTLGSDPRVRYRSVGQAAS